MTMAQDSVTTILYLLFLAVICTEQHSLFTHVRPRSKRNQNERLSESGSCSAPTVENGNIILLDRNIHDHAPGPGESIPNYMSIKFFCNQNYALFPNRSVITCEDGFWTGSIPTCKLICPPLTSSTLDIECTLNNKTVDCNQPVLEGTIAKSKCKEYYISVHTYSIPTIRCKGGYWDNSLIQCVPDCGEGIAKGLTNVVNGTGAKFGEFPWHIALYHIEYDEYVYKCGGSIIHPSVIISAAHCFQDAFGVNIPPDEYYIGAGKHHSAYNSQDDKLAQIRQVKEYHIPPYYSGFESNYQADLAVIIVKTKFRLSNIVRPVCMDWNKEFEREQLLAGAKGNVVGWGYEDPNKLQISKSLKKLAAPFIEISKCLTVVPDDFKRWVTPDKFCAGFTTGFSVCQGDSGGGMVFPWTINNKQKYYLRGVVSVGPMEESNGLCDSHQYGVYTQITYYSDFIQDILANYTEETTTKTCFSSSNSYGSCQIPKIENGKFTYLDKHFLPGYSIPNYSYMQISCNKNFVLYPNKRYINCLNSTWHIPVPQCKRTCPPLLISPFVKNIICTVDDKTVKCTKPVVDGAVAQIICNDDTETFSKCAAGSWDKRDPFSRCKPDIPIVLVTTTTQNPKPQTQSPAPPLRNSSCPAPKIENGKYVVVGAGKQTAFTSIPNYAIVNITCEKNYSLYPQNTVVICLDGKWNVWKMPECKQTCAPLISTNVDVTCTLDDKTVNCSKPMVEGTIARSKCKDHYTMADTTSFSRIRCFEGSWDRPLMRCVPECGCITPIGQTHIISGHTIKSSEFPWHVAVYRVRDDKPAYICSGSIITPSVVISAAHCFSTKDVYHIGAGKYYRAYNASEDKLAQIRKVQQYYFPPIYRGIETNYVADLAVIILEKPFELTNVVSPICVDWNRKFERQQLSPGSIGSFVAWGYPESSDTLPTKGLKQVTAPFVEITTCIRSAPYYIQLVTPDKFCAGFRNGSHTPCNGDSGVGLVFPMTMENKIKYYLRGIASVGVSVKESNGSCDDYQFGLYTQITHYSDFIQDIIANNG